MAKLTRFDLGSIFRYIVTGGSAFIIDFALLWLGKSGIGLPAWLAATVAFAVSTVFSFLVQRSWTFNSESEITKSSVKYTTILVVNTLITAVIVQIFDTCFGYYLLGKVVSTVLTTAWNYPLMKNWVYS